MIVDAMLSADADFVLVDMRVVPRAARGEIVGERETLRIDGLSLDDAARRLK
jgi:hypothetical protein